MVPRRLDHLLHRSDCLYYLRRDRVGLHVCECRSPSLDPILPVSRLSEPVLTILPAGAPGPRPAPPGPAAEPASGRDGAGEPLAFGPLPPRSPPGSPAGSGSSRSVRSLAVRRQPGRESKSHRDRDGTRTAAINQKPRLTRVARWDPSAAELPGGQRPILGFMFDSPPSPLAA
jgi:hypothetical protein